MQINGKVFLVTGAGSGLGAVVARRLLEEGARVGLADLDPTSTVTMPELANALPLKMDVTRDGDVALAVERLQERFGSLAGAINCAGIAPVEKIVGRHGVHRRESFDKTLAVNLVGTFNVMRFAADAMSKNPGEVGGERGVIVNTASVAAFEGQVGQLAYAASKGAVAAMTLPAARELATYGIRVVCIAPGVFGTPMMESMPDEIKQALESRVPFPPRLGHPDEFAAMVLEAIRNGYLNGETIRLDGALRMQPR